jgi:eukaryotic-like serine/threonine-protein kinase
MHDSLSRLRSALADRYAIDGELGRGGMATVYRAHDTRHDRTVALKVFRPELAAAVGVERFLAEIRTTANLQHPNILPLFDSGDASDRAGPQEAPLLFYVTPYIEGESLRDRLNREGQLPVDEAVRIAGAVADALEHAHRRGVVHRDIKPENILLHEGRPLVMDFGIALATDEAGAGRLTHTGLALGTPLYMSPEQTEGTRPVDGRSDVYALGCVLYEMLTGEAPHTGPTARAVIAKALSGDPEPLRGRRQAVPVHVEAAVHTALQRLPADRFQDAAAFAAALGDPAYRAPGAAPNTGSKAAWLATAAAAVLLAVALAGWLRSPGSDGRGAPVARLAVQLPDGHDLAVTGGQSYPFDLSRDGTRLVYRAWSGSGIMLYVRPLAGFDAHALPGTEGGRQPFFSPDGEWVGFFAEGMLRKVPVDGGAPIAISAAGGTPFGAHWGPDDTILFSTLEDGLFRVPAGGGPPTPLNEFLHPEAGRSAVDATVAHANLGRPRWPHFLPDGRRALVTTDAGTYVVQVATGEARFIFAGTQARYLPTGHLAYAEGDQRVRVVPFDLRRLEVTGPPLPALDGVFRGPGSGAVNFAVSQTGTLAYIAGGFERSLVIVDRTGGETGIAVQARGFRFPRVSPDGRHIAVTVDPRPSDIWIVDLLRETATRFTTEGHNLAAAWAPDGRHLVFSHEDGQHVAGWPEPGSLRRVGREARPLGEYSPSWSVDGRIFVMQYHPETGYDLIVLHPEDREERPFLVTAANERFPRVSPDGEWVAYVSDVSGVDEVYVLHARRPAAPQLVSVSGGVDPNWSRDGAELYYRRGNTLFAVAVTTGPEFAVGRPTELFAKPYDFTQPENWDVTPDGRFVMVRADPSTSRQFRLVLNWFEELRGH